MAKRQPLADIEEFVGKIAAGKDTQTDANFSIVARVEALIAGWGMEEALRRAEAYRLAGADAILIHSKLSKPDEIVTFAREWARRSPLVIVPTKYYSTPTDVFRKAGISTVIWANHLVRSAVSAMQSVAKEIYESQTLVNVEDRIASVNELFRLQDADEYSAAEKIYLSATGTSRSAVVLAATRGRGLEAITEDKPKVMLPIAGKPLLRWLIDGFKKESINDITVVGGYRADAIETAGIKLVVNERYAETGELASLSCAADALDADAVISYGDLLFRSYVLRDLLETDADFAVVVDSSPTDSNNRTVRDFAECSRADDRGLFGSRVLLKSVSGEPTTHGRWDRYAESEPQRVGEIQSGAGRPARAGRFQHPRFAGAAECVDRGRRRHRSHVCAWSLARRQRSRGFAARRRFCSCSVAHRRLGRGNSFGRDMIEARQFVEAARERGFAWYAGVPCSYLTPFINYVLQDDSLHYVSMANEGDAVALIAGVTLGGEGGKPARGIAMMQNSGLGKAVSPLTSLTWTFRLPQLIIVTWRGQPGVPDEPQHALMGPITPTLLDTMEIPWELFPTEAEAIGPALDRAMAHMDATGRPYALLMQKGSVAAFGLKSHALASRRRVAVPATVHGAAAGPGGAAAGGGSLPVPLASVARGGGANSRHSTVVLAATGFCGRELFATDDRPNQLYMVGSMGCVVALRPRRRPATPGPAGAGRGRRWCGLDAHGRVRDRGRLWSVESSAPIVGQWRARFHRGPGHGVAAVSFADIAAACGYASALDTHDLGEVANWLEAPPLKGPRFARLHIGMGTPGDLPRPTMTPVEVKTRLMQHFKSAGVH